MISFSPLASFDFSSFTDSMSNSSGDLVEISKKFFSISLDDFSGVSLVSTNSLTIK